MIPRRCQHQHCKRLAKKRVLLRIVDSKRKTPSRHYFCNHHANWFDIALLMALMAYNRLGKAVTETQDFDPYLEAA